MAAPRSGPAGNKKMEKHKILIIDDDEFLLDMYALKFRQSGFDAEACFSAPEALEKIRNGLKAEAVLFDLVMPNMDGFEFLRTVKGENLLPGSKLVILSNLGQEEDVKKGMELGADDYIVKAYFTPSEVVRKVRSVLGIAEEGEGVSPAAASSDAAEKI